MTTALKAQTPAPPEEAASIEVAKPAQSLSLAGTLMQAFARAVRAHEESYLDRVNGIMPVMGLR